MSERVDAIAMSDDAIAVHRHECEHCVKPTETSPQTDEQAEEKMQQTEQPEQAEQTEQAKLLAEQKSDQCHGYVGATFAAAMIGVGCLLCHHVAVPVVVAKITTAGVAKIVASKAAIHHFLARVTGQCCCCACNGCQGCCPCSTTGCCFCSC